MIFFFEAVLNGLVAFNSNSTTDWIWNGFRRMETSLLSLTARSVTVPELKIPAVMLIESAATTFASLLHGLRIAFMAGHHIGFVALHFV